MDKHSAIIIKTLMVGETAGHMAMIPNCPTLYSVIEAYGFATNTRPTKEHESFVSFVKAFAEALEKIET